MAKKLKRTRSTYASGMPPAPVKIEGSTPLNKTELLAEYNALLIVMAAFVKENNGRIIIPREAFDSIRKEGKTLQIVPGSDMALYVQFSDFQEAEVTLPESEEATDFFNSSTAQEAREFLAKQRKTNDSE